MLSLYHQSGSLGHTTNNTGKLTTDLYSGGHIDDAEAAWCSRLITKYTGRHTLSTSNLLTFLSFGSKTIPIR
ncbi:MAG: hypothetical protein WCL46_10910 [Chlorobium sp.]